MDALEFGQKLTERLGQVEKAKEELKIEREMLKGEIENSPEYREITEQMEALKLKRKQLIEENKTVIELSTKVKESTEEVKELKEILSAELVYYFKENESPEFEADGKVYKIEVSAKVKETNQRSLFGGGQNGN